MTEAALAWLPALLERKDEHGHSKFTADQRRDFLVAMILTVGVDRRELTPALQAMIESVAAQAGVEPGQTKEETEERFRAYFEEHPVHPELMFELKRGVREEMAGMSRPEVARAIAKRLAQDIGVPKAPGAPAPEGSVRGGPMAWFKAHEKLGNKE